MSIDSLHYDLDFMWLAQYIRISSILPRLKHYGYSYYSIRPFTMTNDCTSGALLDSEHSTDAKGSCSCNNVANAKAVCGGCLRYNLDFVRLAQYVDFSSILPRLKLNRHTHTSIWPLAMTYDYTLASLVNARHSTDAKISSSCNCITYAEVVRGRTILRY